MLKLSRCFYRSCPGVHWILPFTQCLSIRCHSSTTRQEFGRYFEQVVAQCLNKYSFDVAVCGGPRDRGIDFRGVWLLKAKPVRVIGQCRRYKRRLGPKHVRELEGTLSHEAKATLGMIVSESGYSKSAYEVFMGSPHAIVLTTLSGYSDDLLQWYFDQDSYENSDSKHQDIVDFDSHENVQYKRADVYSQSGIKTANSFRSDYLNMNDMDVSCTKGVHYFQEHSSQGEEESNFDNKCANNGFVESDISLITPHYNSSGTTGKDNILLVDDITETDGDREQFPNSDFSEVGQGVFTMFELNPTARKLLPNLVVGVKYRGQNSRTPELFIHIDNSFASLPVK